MLSLYLLRHGESAPEGGFSGDIGRKLTSSGKGRLQRMAGLLKRRGLAFDHLIVSPATRTMETKDVLASELGELDFEIDNAIYEASPRHLIAAVSRQPKKFRSIMLIGHNPGISALASYFSGEDFLSLAPGMMAIIYFNFDDWQLVSSNNGILMEILQ